MDVAPLKWLLLLWVGVIKSQGPLAPISVTYPVAEEEHNPLIGHLLQDAGVDAPVGSQLQLQIIRGDFLELFYLAGENLMTLRPLDREALCGPVYPCMIQLDVTVLVNSQLNWILNVEINVLDINDNSPIFTQQNVTINIPEESDVGTTFDLPAASDKDMGQNSIQGYAISPDIRSTFSVHNYEGPDGTTIPKLVLNNELRRDQTEELMFELISFDGGVPLRSGSVWITINIIYSNDHPPQFAELSYGVTVNENSAIGHLIQIIATDMDSGNNAEISYSFHNKATTSHDGVLSLNDTTGDVTLLKLLDYERKATHHYTIVATDRGNVPLSATAQLIIHVVDLNDCPPKVKIDTQTHAPYTVIPEHSPEATFIAIVTVTDNDSGVNGQVNCTVSNDAFELTHVYANDYQLTVASGLDYETQKNYSLEIACSDLGEPSLKDKSTLDIYISDINDNAPQFERAFYNTSTLENLPVHTSLMTVTAHDTDSADNARINYHIKENNVKRLLSIDSNSGVISTVVSLDRELEAHSHIEFTVIATDKGTPPLSASAQVQVNVIDVNDEAPVFNAVRSFRVSENAHIGASLGKVKATDADGPPFNIIEYSLSDDIFDARSFSIDQNTGEIRTTQLLDREQRQSYYFKVFAKETAAPYHTSSTEFTVSVADVNDNTPIVTFPSSDNNTIHVPFYRKDEYEVTEILATDLDSGINSRLQYMILNGNEDGCFSLDRDDGSLFANGSCLQATQKQEYIFNLLVEDSGRPPKFAYPILYITVDSSNVNGDDWSGTFVNTRETHTWRLAYHHKISLILGSLTIIMVLILISAILIIKAKQRKQRNECDKYINAEEMTRLRRGSYMNSNEHGQIATTDTVSRPHMTGAEQDHGPEDSFQGQPGTSGNQGPDIEQRFGHNTDGDLQDAEGAQFSDNDYGNRPVEQGGLCCHVNVENGNMDMPAPVQVHEHNMEQSDDGTPADMQLYKLLRFLNEVQRNEQQMVSSTTESTHNTTELSAPDSGTGMSEEEQMDECFLANNIAKSPTKSTPKISYVFSDAEEQMRNSGSSGQSGACGYRANGRRHDVLEPDEFYDYQMPAGNPQHQPKIIINTKQKSKSHKPNTFNLKSPKRTLAKLKILQSFSNGSQTSSKESSKGAKLPYINSPPSDRCGSVDSSTETPSQCSSMQSMNSTQTFRNSRKPVTLGTFKPELSNNGYIPTLNLGDHLVETDI